MERCTGTKAWLMFTILKVAGMHVPLCSPVKLVYLSSLKTKWKQISGYLPPPHNWTTQNALLQQEQCLALLLISLH
jgi:hypothetical protein